MTLEPPFGCPHFCQFLRFLRAARGCQCEQHETARPEDEFTEHMSGPYSGFVEERRSDESTLRGDVNPTELARDGRTTDDAMAATDGVYGVRLERRRSVTPPMDDGTSASKTARAWGRAARASGRAVAAEVGAFAARRAETWLRRGHACSEVDVRSLSTCGNVTEVSFDYQLMRDEV